VTGTHVTERLSAYMDGELAAPDRETVAAHLRGCPACARHLEELRAVDAAARELPLAVPDGYFETFRGSLRERLQRARPTPRRWAPPVWSLAAAAAVVLALLTPRLLVRDQPARVAPPAPAPTLPGRSPDAVTPAAPEETRPLVADTEAPAARRAERAEPPPAGRSAQRLAEPSPLGAAPPPPAATPAPAQEQAKNAADAPLEGYAAAPPAEMDEVQGARPKTAAPAKKMEGAPSAAAREEEATARHDKAALGATRDGAAEAPAGEDRFQLLARRTLSSAADARALRDAWRGLARDLGTGARADEARVRAVEAGLEAWRRSGDEGDRAAAERDARAYLERPDALQPARVRDALKALAR
jgi:hypothetical protein